MKNVLVIGTNRLTGRRILNDLSAKPIYSVIGCSLRDDICSRKDYRSVRTDIRDTDAVRRLFNKSQSDIAVDTSVLSAPDYCETHHTEAEVTSVTTVGTISCTCEQYGSRFIHLSTGSASDGKNDQLHKEEGGASPVNYYGITKLKAEKVVADCCSNYAIVCAVVAYRKVLTRQYGNILQLVANRLREGEPIRVVSDQWRTPTLVEGISEGVEKLMFHSSNGIYHICGDECLAIAGIVYWVVDFLKLNCSLTEPVTTEGMQEVTPHPRFSRLSIEKVKTEIGYDPHTSKEGMAVSLF